MPWFPIRPRMFGLLLLMNPTVRQSHWPVLGMGWVAVMYWTAERYQTYLRGDVRIPQKLLCTPEQTELAYVRSFDPPLFLPFFLASALANLLQADRVLCVV